VAQHLLSLEGRTEHVIAAGRAVLAAASLLAIWLDASEPSKYASLTYALLATYVLYSLAIFFIVSAASRSFSRLPLATHAFDLAAFTVFIYLTEGPTSPFFVYFVFSILCAMLRWQWRGALLTAAIALTAFIGMGIYAGEVLHDPTFELNRFIIRAFYLVVVAALLAYVGVHELRRRSQIARLALWSRIPAAEVRDVLIEVLKQAANILEAPRTLLIWDDEEEPWVNVVEFEGGKLKWDHKPPGSFSPLVESSLDDRSFLSIDVSRGAATIVEQGSSTAAPWYGEALNRELRDSYNIRSVLSVPVVTGNFRGRLFFLDRPAMSVDDVPLAELVAGQAAASIDLNYFMYRIRRIAALEERIRLSSDLHDGVLQSLTAAGLRLQSALQLVETSPREASQQLQTVQEIIAQEKLDLRVFVDDLKRADLASSKTGFSLAYLLEQLRSNVEQQWGLRVHVKLEGVAEALSHTLARDIFHIVREALVNAARHSGGTSANVRIHFRDNKIYITVSDDGCGFPFSGTFDQSELMEMNAGPASLGNRISLLRGSLRIHSTTAGARLDIVLPIERAVA
jgi:signal transduction histidine kinase